MFYIDYKKIKHYYNTIGIDGKRMWSIEMVKDAVKMKKINKEQFEYITGEKYI